MQRTKTIITQYFILIYRIIVSCLFTLEIFVQSRRSKNRSDIDFFSEVGMEAMKSAEHI